jgi:HEAT repeat protein
MEPPSTHDGVQTATAIFRALTADRLTEKYKAVELLDDKSNSIDLITLRTLLLRAINRDFKVGREDEFDDPSIAGTRSWLLGALGRISAGDHEATELLTKHVRRDYEPHNWARYWSLEGLITGKNPKTAEVAKSLVEVKNDPLVQNLATAFLALDDTKIAQKLKQDLEDPDKLWFVLRALRIVPIPITVSAICELVKNAQYTDATYDAIMALGKIPGDWTHSTIASQALSACILKLRGSPWMDGMRTAAITGLGNLKIESSGPLIIEELVDDNPAVVREAARSIEKILGLHVTVIRILEAASKSGAASIDAYGRALRWLNRNDVAEELGSLMLTGSAQQQEIARSLLSDLGGAVAYEKLRARTDAMKQYTDVLERTEQKIRSLFEQSVQEAQRGFHVAVVMDAVVFGIGVVLLLGSAGYALLGTGDLAKWAGVGLSAGTGVLAVLYSLLIANPRRQVTESVDHLMRVKIVFLAYLRRLHQTDQAYTRRLLDDDLITADELKRFGDIVGEIMTDTIEQHLDGNSSPKLRAADDQAVAKA